MVRFEFESRIGLFCFFYLCFIWRIAFACLVVCRWQVAGAAWCAAMRIVVGVADLMHRTGDDRTGQVLGGWAIERSGGAVCGLHRAHENEERGFLG
jgi:hypothetical protein